DLIRAFTTPVLPPEPAPLHASSYPSWPGGITTPQPRQPANIGATLRATQPGLPATPHSERAAKTATPVATLQSEKAAKTAIPTTPTAATPIISPLPASGAAARATVEAEQQQPPSAARLQEERAATLPKTKIAAKTATPTPHAASKTPQPRRPASAKRKPQLILPSPQRLAAHPAT
ncbi:MAG: hypothetical protein ACXWP0_16375, partial [Ktedonobacterales bacterium]